MVERFSANVAVRQSGAVGATVSFWQDGVEVSSGPPLDRKALEKLQKDIDWALQFIDKD